MNWSSFDSNYFDSIAKWINEEIPGVYKMSQLTKDVEKLQNYLHWYSLCRPTGFNRVIYTNEEVVIIKDISENGNK